MRDLKSLVIFALVVSSISGCDRVNERRARRYANQAVQLIKAQQYSAARPLLKQALDTYPHDSHTHYLMGRVCENLNEPQDAIQAYQRSIYIYAKNEKAHFSLAGLYLKNKNPAEAARHYEKVVELNPDYEFAPYQLGLAYHQYALTLSKELAAPYYSKAEQAFEKMLAKNPKFTDAYNGLAGTFLDQAKALEPPPPPPPTPEELEKKRKEEEEAAKKKGKKGKKEPKEEYKPVLKEVPEEAKPFYRKAEAVLLRAIQNSAANEQSYNLLGLAYQALRQFDQAVQILKKAKDTNIYSAQVTYNLAVAYDTWLQVYLDQARLEKDKDKIPSILAEGAKKREMAIDSFKDFLQIRSGDEGLKGQARMRIQELTIMKEKELAKSLEEEKRSARKKPRRRR